jgi:hypothetical protein
MWHLVQFQPETVWNIFVRNVIAYFDQQQCRVMEIFAEDLETEVHSVSPANEIGLPYVYTGDFPTTP